MGQSIPRISSSCSPICRLALSSARRQTTWRDYVAPFPPSRNSRDASEGAPRVTPEIAAALGELPQYTRTTTDAFLHEATREAIRKTARKTLLIAGVATEIIVQHSALSGATHGFHVQIVVDACAGLSARTEDAALRRLVHAGVVTTSIPSIAGQLAGDFTQPKGMQALGILYEMASP